MNPTQENPMSELKAKLCSGCNTFCNHGCLRCHGDKQEARIKELEAALKKIAKPALGGKQQQWIAQEALKGKGG